MRSNAYYIRCHRSQLSTQQSFVNGASFKSYSDLRSSGNIIPSNTGSPVCEGYLKSSGLLASLNKSPENKKFCKRENSTFSLIQGVLKGIVNSGSNLAKSMKSVIFASGKRQPFQGRMQAVSLATKKNCDKENVIPRIVPYTFGNLRHFQRYFLRNEDMLVDHDSSFKHQTSTPCSTKRGNDTLTSRGANKKIRCDPKNIFHISELSEKSSTRRNMVQRKCRTSRVEQALCRNVGGESRDGNSYATQHHMEWFLQLLENPILNSFLEADICYRYADNYLLAMVFAYFVRSRLSRQEYTKENFFAALYLAHDMEEDEEELKYEVFPWALGKKWHCKYSNILKRRDAIFWKIDCRAVVSKKCCDQVMEMLPGHRLWTRVRPYYHGGARREYQRHPDENGYPRGPFKSPLQCQQCLERTCMESSSSYILYISDSESSVDEQLYNVGDTEEHKDSGFETRLYDTSDNFDRSNEFSMESVSTDSKFATTSSNKTSRILGQ
ncbi:uncharacterized protein LOC135205894 [Macrobrachium nipponense]|uniref:uncharacterized protein LOC135205894 n=1 Tax=Macrobrachium nipponense TaxID=159736 RepID=UPI0030C84F4D